MRPVTTLPFGRPLTRADLEALPDDGHRYLYVDTACAAGTQAAEPTRPFPVRMVPAELLA